MSVNKVDCPCRKPDFTLPAIKGKWFALHFWFEEEVYAISQSSTTNFLNSISDRDIGSICNTLTPLEYINLKVKSTDCPKLYKDLILTYLVERDLLT